MPGMCCLSSIASPPVFMLNSLAPILPPNCLTHRFSCQHAFQEVHCPDLPHELQACAVQAHTRMLIPNHHARLIHEAQGNCIQAMMGYVVEGMSRGEAGGCICSQALGSPAVLAHSVMHLTIVGTSTADHQGISYIYIYIAYLYRC